MLYSPIYISSPDFKRKINNSCTNLVVSELLVVKGKGSIGPLNGEDTLGDTVTFYRVITGTFQYRGNLNFEFCYKKDDMSTVGIFCLTFMVMDPNLNSVKKHTKHSNCCMGDIFLTSRLECTSSLLFRHLWPVLFIRIIKRKEKKKNGRNNEERKETRKKKKRKKYRLTCAIRGRCNRRSPVSTGVEVRDGVPLDELLVVLLHQHGGIQVGHCFGKENVSQTGNSGLDVSKPEVSMPGGMHQP